MREKPDITSRRNITNATPGVGPMPAASDAMPAEVAAELRAALQRRRVSRSGSVQPAGAQGWHAVAAVPRRRPVVQLDCRVTTLAPLRIMADDVIGVVLAGGQSRRMGGADKGLALLAGRPLIAHVIARAAPQVRTLIVNTNVPERHGALDLPLVADDLPAGVEAFAGPLAGVLAGLDWAAARAPAVPWVATFAADAPFVPRDLVGRLRLAVDCESTDLACAASGGRSHPVFGLWPVRLRRALRRALVEEGVRKVDAWTARYELVEVSYGARPIDPFFNVNRPEDLAEAERLYAS